MKKQKHRKSVTVRQNRHNVKRIKSEIIQRLNLKSPDREFFITVSGVRIPHIPRHIRKHYAESLLNLFY